LRADLYSPPTTGRIAVIAVHGGAWLHNDRAVFAPIAAELARRSGFVVLNIEYPRAPAGGDLYARQRAAFEQAVAGSAAMPARWASIRGASAGWAGRPAATSSRWSGRAAAARCAAGRAWAPP
jgi:hypothetical protein